MITAKIVEPPTYSRNRERLRVSQPSTLVENGIPFDNCHTESALPIHSTRSPCVAGQSPQSDPFPKHQPRSATLWYSYTQLWKQFPPRCNFGLRARELLQTLDDVFAPALLHKPPRVPGYEAHSDEDPHRPHSLDPKGNAVYTLVSANGGSDDDSRFCHVVN
ncbi:hypothetical protein PDIDSM_7722 [Penicillium digitatum]|nr:hypothetical protein PDIDSM_7722 [Penicillium digitatum]